jgi:hypothetical protein
MKKNVFAVFMVVLIATSGMLGSAFLLSRFFIRIQKEENKSISVKGYAETQVKSDFGKFSINILVSNSKLIDGYKDLETGVNAVEEQLNVIGFKQPEISRGIISITKIYQKVAGKNTNDLEAYEISQEVFVSSANVELIERRYKEIFPLIARGIELTITPPDYFVADLNKYKVKLLAEAAANARERALAIVEKSGGILGKIISARQGVIQITAPCSDETSDYGAFDTKSPEKIIKTVVTADFMVN